MTLCNRRDRDLVEGEVSEPGRLNMVKEENRPEMAEDEMEDYVCYVKTWRVVAFKESLKQEKYDRREIIGKHEI